MSLSRVALPSELWDAIIDYLHDDPAVLRLCALVCRTWVPASRFHSFEAIFLSQKSGLRAAQLNTLLGSPCGTIAPAVRMLDFPDALAPIQIRNPCISGVHVKTLLALVPRITRLQHVRALSLSDLPWPLLGALKNVEDLTLTGVCMGPCLLDIAAALPRLTHLTLNGVSAIPYRQYPCSAAPLAHLHTVTVNYSPLAVLGWLAFVAPHTKTLSVDGLVARDLDYLVSYISVIGPALEILDLAFFGTPLDELMLPLLLQPCTNLKILRLRFDSTTDVRRFFAFGGIFADGCPAELRLEIVLSVAALSETKMEGNCLSAGLIQHGNVDVRTLQSE